MELLGTMHKLPFTELPFVKYLFIGANNKGCWNMFCMSLQLEDVVNYLQVLFPKFDLVFLFDHSPGHARWQDNTLSSQHMSNPTKEHNQQWERQQYYFQQLKPLLVTWLAVKQQHHNSPTGTTKLVKKSKKQPAYWGIEWKRSQHFKILHLTIRLDYMIAKKLLHLDGRGTQGSSTISKGANPKFWVSQD